MLGKIWFFFFSVLWMGGGGGVGASVLVFEMQK